MATVTDRRRGRGERAGLDVAAIVAAARALPPGGVTMQAVADALGVDRKAISNHVRDRDDLLERVAADAVATHLAGIAVARDAGWPDVCRAYARGLADAVVESDALSRHYRHDAPQRAVLGPAEIALGSLVAAGFDDETAARALSMLTTIATGFAHSRIAAARDAATPLAARLRRTFAADAHAYSHIERITASSVRTSDPAQLDLMLDLFVDGLRARLSR